MDLDGSQTPSLYGCAMFGGEEMGGSQDFVCGSGSHEDRIGSDQGGDSMPEPEELPLSQVLNMTTQEFNDEFGPPSLD